MLGKRSDSRKLTSPMSFHFNHQLYLIQDVNQECICQNMTFSEEMVLMLSLFRRSPIKSFHRSLLLQESCHFSSAPDSLVVQVLSHCGLLRIPDRSDLFLAGDVLSPRFCDKYKPADHKMHGQKLAPTAKPPPMPYQTKDCKLHVQGEFILDLRAQVAKRCRNSMIQYFVTL